MFERALFTPPLLPPCPKEGKKKKRNLFQVSRAHTSVDAAKDMKQGLPLAIGQVVFRADRIGIVLGEKNLLQVSDGGANRAQHRGSRGTRPLALGKILAPRSNCRRRRIFEIVADLCAGRSSMLCCEDWRARFRFDFGSFLRGGGGGGGGVGSIARTKFRRNRFVLL